MSATPAYQDIGVSQADNTTGSITVPWPVSHQKDDIALLLVECTGGQTSSLTTANGFAEITNSPQSTGTGTAGTSLHVYWCRATSSSMASPVLSVGANHGYGVILTFRNVANSGNPWNITAGAVKAAASTSASTPTVTTTVANCLIVAAIARDDDSAAAEFSAWTNAALASITERQDEGTALGNGGGIGVATGLKTAAGATGTTTATVVSSINASLTIALLPGPVVGDGFGQVQADIRHTSSTFGQALADIKVFGSTQFAQATADIKTTSFVFGQAQTDIKTSSRVYSQAQARILQHYPFSGSKDYNLTVLAEPTLVSYWRLGTTTGTTQPDSKGTKTLTLTGTPLLGVKGLVYGDPGRAIQWDGATQYGTFDDSDTNLPNGNNPWTLEAWILTTDLKASNDIVGFGTQTTTLDTAMGLSAGALRFGGHQDSQVFGGFFADGAPHHVVLTYDGTSLIGYGDGVQIGSPITIPSRTIHTTGSNDGHIGVWVDFFDGIIDEVAIYASTLSSASVAAHFASRVFPGFNPFGQAQASITLPPGTRTHTGQANALISHDSLQNTILNMSGRQLLYFLNEPSGTVVIDQTTQNNGTYIGAMTLGGAALQVGEFGSVSGFVGNTAYIQAKNGQLIGNLTNATVLVSMDGGSMERALYSERASTGNDIWKLDIAQTSQGGVVLRLVHRDDAGTLDEPLGNTNVVTGTHHVVAIVKSGTTITFYVDGIADGGGTLTGTDTMTNAGIEAWVGADKGDATRGPWPNSIGFVALFNRALAPTEIASIYKAATTALFTRNASGQAQAKITATLSKYGEGQAQADILVTNYRLAQAQVDILVTKYGLAQTQSDIKQSSFGLAQAQADILHTSFVFGQAQTDILHTSFGLGQTQTDIKVTKFVFAQAQSDVLHTSFDLAQAQADILKSSFGLGQTQVDILHTSFIEGQAQTDIKATKFGLAQAQADIKVTSYVFAQAQSDILVTQSVFGQAQAKLNGFPTKVAQAQAYITIQTLLLDRAITKTTNTQKSAWISPHSLLSGRTFIVVTEDDTPQSVEEYATKPLKAGTYSGHAFIHYAMWVDDPSANVQIEYAIALAERNGDYDPDVGGPVATGIAMPTVPGTFTDFVIPISTFTITAGQRLEFDSSYGAFGGTIAGGHNVTFGDSTDYPSWVRLDFAVVQLEWEAFGQAQADIQHTGTSQFAQAQAKIISNFNVGYAQAQTDVLVTTTVSAQATADIKVSSLVFAQAQADILHTSFGFGQVQSDVLHTSFGLGQAQADIKKTSYGFGQVNADIKQTGLGFGQAQTDIKVTKVIFAQAQTDILVRKYVVAQAQTDVKATGFGEGQALADIKTTSFTEGQAQADIRVTSYGFGQAQTDITLADFGFGQAQTDIRVTSYTEAQSQANIKVTSFVVAQAQTDIRVTDYVVAQAQADIRVTKFGIAQAQADIKASGFGFGQAQTRILTTEYVFAQAQAKLNAFGVNAFGQAQAAMGGQSWGFGQAQAKIKAFGVTRFGQAQTDIKTTSYSFGQAQTTIQANRFAQAQADIKVTNYREAQAQADIKVTSYVSAQSQADIKTIKFAFAQAQTRILTTTNVFAQAQADVLVTNFKESQAQADIKVTSYGLGQSQVDIKKTTFAYGQAQARIVTTICATGQAQVYIQGRVYAQAQADIRVTSTQSANAQADIKVSVNYSGQANALIVATSFEFGQARAYIHSTVAQIGQAQVYISLHGLLQVAQAQAFIIKAAGYGQAQARIILLHTLEDLEITDSPSINLDILDKDSIEEDYTDHEFNLTLYDIGLGFDLIDRGLNLTIADFNYVGESQ